MKDRKAPPLKGRGWGGAVSSGNSKSASTDSPTPCPSPEGEGLKVREAIRASAQKLRQCTESATLDAELLTACFLGISREEMLLRHLDDKIDGTALEPLIARRLAHEPIAYITGFREFWGLEFAVRPGVLIPRPDSETLIETALSHCAQTSPASILDLGTGSGALLLAALSEFPGAKGLGMDRSETALCCARHNAERLGLGGRAAFRIGDWGEGLEGRFDLILCNPPYVEESAALAPDVRDYEPYEALFSGADGLDDIRRLAPQIPALLAPGGIACIEIGHMQGLAATALFAAQSLKTAIRQDLAGRDRCLLIHK